MEGTIGIGVIGCGAIRRPTAHHANHPRPGWWRRHGQGSGSRGRQALRRPTVYGLHRAPGPDDIRRKRLHAQLLTPQTIAAAAAGKHPKEKPTLSRSKSQRDDYRRGRVQPGGVHPSSIRQR